MRVGSVKSCPILDSWPTTISLGTPRIGIPRQPVPGFKLWELHHGTRVATCELRDDGQRGAGVDVQLLEDGDIVISKRCLRRDGAEYVAQAFRQDYGRQG